MRLAGQMRLNTFLGLAGLIVATAGIAAVGGVAHYVASRPHSPPPSLPSPAPPPVAISAPAPAASPTSAPASPAPATAVRPVDEVVLGYRGKAIATDKLKDVTQGRPYKVNVYQDAGQATVNRVKVDLDRDDKWDEKVTFEPDRITRQVASRDDEAYDLTFHWDGAAWVSE